MGSVARWLVGASVLFTSAHAFGEAAPPQAPPPQQAAPQPAPPIKNPPAPQPQAAPVQKKAPAKAPVKAQAKKAPAKKALPPAKNEKAATTAAQPVADDAQSPGCQVMPVKGTPLFEARYANGKKLVLTRLYATGTFTRLMLKDLRTSCIEKEQLAAIQNALGEAPWITTKSAATCVATSAESTAISTAGRLRFTSKQCNPLVLDEKSSRALDLVASYVGAFGLDFVDDARLD
jgi:hypothetical protein